MDINAIAAALGGTTGLGTSASITSSATDGSAANSSFSKTLASLVDATETNSEQANKAVSGMLDKSVDVHDAMIALQRAEMSLQLTVAIRNKLVAAYQDVMRMPV